MTRGRVLSDKKVIKLVSEKFESVNLNLIKTGWPVQFEAIKSWKRGYDKWEKSGKQGFTMSVIVSPDGERVLGKSDSGHLWEADTSNAYDPRKYEKLLQKCHARHVELGKITADETLTDEQKTARRKAFDREVLKEVIASSKPKPKPEWWSHKVLVELLQPIFRGE